MVRMLSLTENLHTILRVLYDDMMALCYPMSQVAMAIAGIGALLYIAYRVWQSLAQAEPIDLFPLMRPFAIGICILFFPTLVLGTLNGILSPLVKATHSLMAGQTLDMEQWQERRERLELESLAMRHDTELMEQGYNWYVDWSSSLNLIFMLVAVCGYLCIPSIASWVVQANGFAAYNKTVSKMTSLVSAGAGWTAGKAWAGAKGAGSAALSGGKAVGRGIMNGARLIFRK